MRRSAAATLGGVMVTACVLAGGASGAEPGGRRVFQRYSPAQLTSPLRVNVEDPGVSLSDVPFRSRRGETSVVVEIEDDSGTPVFGRIEQGGRDSIRFCGATDGPVGITPAKQFVVIVYSGPCAGSTGAATQGAVEVTFHRAGGGS